MSETGKGADQDYSEFTLSVAKLWQGAILTTIAHALFISSDPLLSYELSWDGPNYSRQNSQGARGTVSFTQEGETVGAFFDASSPRSPFRSNQKYTLEPYLKGIPQNLFELAQSETLQYLLENLDGKPQPVITAAFWSERGKLTAAEEWSKVIKHGAHLLHLELLPLARALKACQTEYEFSDQQLELVKRVFDRKIVSPSPTVRLEPAEYKRWIASGRDGLAEGQELLSTIGILIS